MKNNLDSKIKLAFCRASIPHDQKACLGLFEESPHLNLVKIHPARQSIGVNKFIAVGYKGELVAGRTDPRFKRVIRMPSTAESDFSHSL